MSICGLRSCVRPSRSLLRPRLLMFSRIRCWGALPGSSPVSDNSPVRTEVWSCNDVVVISVQLAARLFSAVIGYVKWRGVVNGPFRF